jgi:hypothetical protein
MTGLSRDARAGTAIIQLYHEVAFQFNLIFKELLYPIIGLLAVVFPPLAGERTVVNFLSMIFFSPLLLLLSVIRLAAAHFTPINFRTCSTFQRRIIDCFN